MTVDHDRILTRAEAAQWLRLDEPDLLPPASPAVQRRLQRLVDSGLIRPCRIGKCNRFLLSELIRFASAMTEQRGEARP